MKTTEYEQAIRRTRMARVSAGVSRETADSDRAYAVAAEAVARRHLEGAVSTLEQGRDEFRAALAADESAEFLRDLMRDSIEAADSHLEGR